ncbi:TPA: hypothetical protein QDC27_003193 [Burkholderia cepacia ATCC 25416]|uniref:DUF6765 family protein n=1 Tax=Burkholderia TaxID=32008 RepID=UPI000756CE73|nr:DUF6765 family protein [Burkholderia cepacia]HDR9767688.1 hypothetical protein [Burkholderia cepacia ATCC 25416]KUY73031.1 hypothetical protein WI27_25275 [Burkholderia cepacia]MCA8030626.1 hypothetical protein [Burkholderia cepacia]MCA8078599.1 hypothetical protein [Burkholderia cepacia]RRA17300.1 hypothetical protein DF038_34435 [Burkholderia cepacia]
MRVSRCLLVCAAALAMPLTCAGFEADVHFGLTLWLARQAGFAPRDAEAVALADQRIDAGSIEYMTSPLQYACLSRFIPDADDAQVRHYPGTRKVPADARDRTVVPGGPVALASVDAALGRAGGGRAAFMLGEFGRALHAWQDSWAHRGTPSVPDRRRDGIACDAGLAMAAPLDQGAPSSHAAELTWRRPADVDEMAKATYLQMIRYPKPDGAGRQAAPWDQVRQRLAGFADARTKRAKSDWFVANGIADTSFLDGISLPDGPGWKAVRWHGRRALPTPLPPAMQAGADPNLVDFYTRFFRDWVTTSPVDRRWLPALSAGRGHKPDDALVDALVGWRLRDHGAYLAAEGSTHSTARSSAPARNRASFEVFSSLNDAVLPLIVEGDKPSPVLPFLVFPLPRSGDGSPRAVALIKLLDSPYDTVGVVSEKRDGEGWKVTGWVSSADY